MYNNKKRSNGFGQKRNAYGGGGRSHSGGNDRFSQRSESFKANCAQCHNDCHVPFKPNGRKPVLCSDCFGRQQGGGNDRSDRSDRFNRSDRFDRSERTPSRRSFDGPRVKRQSDDTGLQDELKQIRKKLEQILELMRETSVDEQND